MGHINAPRRAIIALPVVLLALVAALGLPSQARALAPSTLSGEFFNATWSPSNGIGAPPVDAHCDPAGMSSISLNVAGPVAFGPYPGTFTERATFTFGPQITPKGDLPAPPDPSRTGEYARGELTGALVTGSVEFTIDSPAGSVTGTKTYSGALDSFGICRSYDNQPLPAGFGGGTGSGYLWTVYGTLDYVAQIHSTDGDWQDRGRALVYFGQETLIRNDGSGTEMGTLQEAFASSGTLEALGPATVTLTPPAGVNDVATNHVVTASVKNAASGPVTGIAVLFTVTGSVNRTLSCTTDGSGSCSVSYTGPSLPGADIITGCADSDRDGLHGPAEPCGEASKAWLLPTSTPGQVTGGGHVLDAADHQAVAFGFNAQSDAKGLKGNCSVVDLAPARNMKIKCLTVDTLVQSTNHATFFGQADVNGAITNYRVDVTDVGEPGAGRDLFYIETGSGYAAGGILDNGNVQVHQR